jgi:hypothetical protein
MPALPEPLSPEGKPPPPDEPPPDEPPPEEPPPEEPPDEPPLGIGMPAEPPCGPIGELLLQAMTAADNPTSTTARRDLSSMIDSPQSLPQLYRAAALLRYFRAGRSSFRQ